MTCDHTEANSVTFTNFSYELETVDWFMTFSYNIFNKNNLLLGLLTKLFVVSIKHYVEVEFGFLDGHLIFLIKDTFNGMILKKNLF